MKIDWRTEVPMWALLALVFALTAMSWAGAPDQIPVHWGLNGQPDRWGGRAEGLLALPFVSLGIYLLLLFIPRIDPGRANYATFAKTYAVLRLLVLLFLTSIDVMILMSIRGEHVDMARKVPLLVGALLVILGNLLGRIRPNWFVGIRTPWTLSSKESWTRTHRAGGWVLMASGLLFMTCAFFRERTYAIGVEILLGASILGLFVYSYLVWRNDPDKVPPAGTSPAGS